MQGGYKGDDVAGLQKVLHDALRSERSFAAQHFLSSYCVPVVGHRGSEHCFAKIESTL